MQQRIPSTFNLPHFYNNKTCNTRAYIFHTLQNINQTRIVSWGKAFWVCPCCLLHSSCLESFFVGQTLTHITPPLQSRTTSACNGLLHSNKRNSPIQCNRLNICLSVSDHGRLVYCERINQGWGAGKIRRHNKHTDNP